MVWNIAHAHAQLCRLALGLHCTNRAEERADGLVVADWFVPIGSLKSSAASFFTS